MRSDFDVSYINDTVIDVYVEPALERYQIDPNFDNSSLEITWAADSFKG